MLPGEWEWPQPSAGVTGDALKDQSAAGFLHGSPKKNAEESSYLFFFYVSGSVWQVFGSMITRTCLPEQHQST